MADNTIREVRYNCSNARCGNTQVLRYWLDESIIPVTCCVQCKAGFGRQMDEMIMNRLGMFPAVEQGVAA